MIMKKTFLILVMALFWSGAGSNVFAQSKAVVADKYQRQWEKIIKAEDEGLPQTALKESRIAFSLAQKEKKGPAMLKSLALILRFQQQIEPDSVKIVFMQMEKEVSQAQDPVFQSMLHSVLAESYLDYFREKRWEINKRTAVAGDVSEDMNEWTSARFEEIIVKHLQLSVQKQALLYAASTDTYRLIIEKGKDSPRLRPTLLDLLTYRLVEMLGDDDFREHRSVTTAALKDLKSRHVEKGNKEAALMAGLELLELDRNEQMTEEDYEKSLLALQNQYRDNPISVEVDLKLANYYSSKEEEGAEKALRICREAISRFPKYERIGLVQSLANQITAPSMNFSMPSQLYPDQKSRVKISYKNINEIVLRFYRVDAPVTVDILDKKSYHPRRMVQELKIRVSDRKPYLQQDTVVSVVISQIGNYMAEANSISSQSKGDTSRTLFSVSRIGAVSRSAAGATEIIAADFFTGKPLTNATVILYKGGYRREYTESSRGKTAMHGLFTVTRSKVENYYQVVMGDDVYSPISSLPYAGNPISTATGSDYEKLFTDRQLYRPGQTVYFKGIAYRSSLERGSEAQELKQVTVTLSDANGKEIDKKDLITNEFGSYAGEFVLPKQALNGGFTLRTRDASAWFTVAEYKLPKFRMVMQKADKSYRFGDLITVKGNAETFSGVKMTGQIVKYKVVRRLHWFCRWGGMPETIISTGVAKTDAKGEFFVSFLAEKEKNNARFPWLAYNFSVEASLTDQTGETQQSEISIPVGDVSLAINFDMPEEVDREHLPMIIIKANNLSGIPVIAHGTYQLFRYENRSLEELDQEKEAVREKKARFDGEFEANKPLNVDRWAALPSGDYVIVAETKDEQGRPIKEEHKFTLFHFYETNMPKTAYVWMHKSVTECRVGEAAVILFGSSADADVLFEVYDNKSMVDRKRLNLNNNVRRVVVPFLSGYGKSITVQFSFFRNGKFFHESVTVKQADPERKISMRWSSFRDKTMPGQKEEWKLTVRDREEYPLKAEVLAEMYDLSLDQIQPYQPEFTLPSFTTHALNPWFSTGDGFDYRNGWMNFSYKSFRARELEFDRFSFDKTLSGRGRFRAVNFDKGTDDIAAPVATTSMITEEAAEPFTIVESESAISKNVQLRGMMTKKAGAINLLAQKPVQPVRQKFAETAFFYPQLKTNREGEVVISFTVPDNLTDWKFIGRAHTKDMRCVQLLDTVSVRKELMIEPYLPRFVRQGDQVVFTSRVSNLSEKVMSGKVRAEFFNPFTGKALEGVQLKDQLFQLQAGANTTAAWTLDIPAGAEMLGCRFFAESDQFSDGEEQIFPVLPKRQLVTEAIPVNLSGMDEKKIVLPLATATQSDYRISLEVVSNPAWYAVQALPVVAAPASEDLISWVTAYYANALATHIVAANPGIQSYLKTAPLAADAQESLRSKLEKNEELKSVIISETPWLNEAIDETRQKQSLSELLDVNRTKELSEKALSRMTELQNADGSFAWFPKMPGSEWLTQFVVSSFTRLESLGAIEKNTDHKVMLTKAVRFLDDELLKSFEWLKKNNKDWARTATLSFFDLQTLMLRSYYPQPEMNAKVKEAYSFYQTLAEQQWVKGSLQEKAVTLILMKKRQNLSIVDRILKSIKEYGNETPEMGYFFPSLVPDHRWGRSALVIHTQIMEAFELMGTEAATLKKMQIWLLKQKQTERWQSLPETVNAVYALLKRDSDLLSATGKLTVKNGDKVVLKSKDESPTFEYKTEIPVAEFNRTNREIVFTKGSPGVTWGAVYRQYFDDMDMIKAQKGALTVTKTLYREIVTGNQKTLEPVTAATPFKVGDKAIVRLIVKADRDLDFVHLKDSRSACLEPVEQLSGCRWKDGVCYYQETKDASTQFFFNQLNKGTYVFEYPVWVNRAGTYTGGMATAQCLYAPEFVGHSAGERIEVKP